MLLSCRKVVANNSGKIEKVIVNEAEDVVSNTQVQKLLTYDKSNKISNIIDPNAKYVDVETWRVERWDDIPNGSITWDKKIEDISGFYSSDKGPLQHKLFNDPNVTWDK
jgi:hypothetical protein